MSTANPTALYRHYDEAGVLLYVGISLSAVNRLGQHKRNAWFWSIRRVDVEYFSTRRAARQAEQTAIQTEKPLFNMTHAPKPKKTQPPPITGRWRRGWREGGIDQRGEESWRLRWRDTSGKRFSKTFRGDVSAARAELRRLIIGGPAEMLGPNPGPGHGLFDGESKQVVD